LRETGQALDRVAIKAESLATTKRTIGDDPVRYQDFLSRHRHQFPLLKRGRPIVSPDVAFLAPCSTLIGSVYIGSGSSVFYKSILRADSCLNAGVFDLQEEDFVDKTMQDHIWSLDSDTDMSGGGIFIGQNTNIQDGCIIDSTKSHTIIGNGVTVGHLASIHSATIHDSCLIGMGSLLQPGVVVKSESMVAAGANVTPNTVIEEGELWVGNPARKLRDLTAQERQKLHYQATEYVQVASSQKEIMSLGGNLPDSMEHYIHAGNHDDIQNEENNNKLSQPTKHE
jgi:carbonic anhydrase/acetyltransferase-like protein (isoleucine patch superfamily)